jgi:hypothetical protein
MDRITAIRRACIGKQTEYHEEGSRWNSLFIPTRYGVCREVALSVSGEIKEGFEYTIVQGEIKLI